MPLEEDEGCGEEATGSQSHEGDGMTVSAPGGGRGGGGVVAALGAALSGGWEGT